MRFNFLLCVKQSAFWNSNWSSFRTWQHGDGFNFKITLSFTHVFQCWKTARHSCCLTADEDFVTPGKSRCQVCYVPKQRNDNIPVTCDEQLREAKAHAYGRPQWTFQYAFRLAALCPRRPPIHARLVSCRENDLQFADVLGLLTILCRQQRVSQWLHTVSTLHDVQSHLPTVRDIRRYRIYDSVSVFTLTTKK